MESVFSILPRRSSTSSKGANKYFFLISDNFLAWTWPPRTKSKCKTLCLATNRFRLHSRSSTISCITRMELTPPPSAKMARKMSTTLCWQPDMVSLDYRIVSRITRKFTFAFQGTDKNGMDYWIVKNSWGYDWGFHGYFHIERGVNMCGLAQCTSFALIKPYGDNIA